MAKRSRVVGATSRINGGVPPRHERQVIVEIYDGPDSHGRYHYDVLWAVNYTPEFLPLEEGKLRWRAQCFFGDDIAGAFRCSEKGYEIEERDLRRNKR